MKSIRIKNLRCLKDTGDIEIRPITILLGENSSGKSTFLRSLPLFRQSVEANTTGPILWFGKYVDFGEFKTAVNKYSQEKEIEFTFNFMLPRMTRYAYRYDIDQEPLDSVTALINVIEDPKRDSIVNKYTIIYEGQQICFTFSPEGKVESYYVNSRDYSSLTNNMRAILPRSLFPVIAYSDAEGVVLSQRMYLHSDMKVLSDIMINKVKKYVRQNVQEKTIYKIINEMNIGSTSNMLRSIKKIGGTRISSWINSTKDWTEDTQDFIDLRDDIIAASFTYLTISCQEIYSDFAKKVRYIAPLRATAERYYRSQNLAIDEIDFQGQNLAMLLKSLSTEEIKKFSDWTYELFGFSPKSSISSGHVSIEINQGIDNNFNLADMGFGFSQVLPILTQLWLIVNKKTRLRYRRFFIPITFVIEQPELHLHPKLQSRLAYAFSNIIDIAQQANIEIRLIIETHSKYLVNAFGHLISNNKISPNDLNVVIFEKRHPEEATNIRISGYDENGYLTNWPIGFFEPNIE